MIESFQSCVYQVSSHHSLHSRRVSLVPPGSRRMSLVTQSPGSRRMSLMGSRRPSFCIPGLGSRRSSLLSTGGDLSRASSSFNLLPEVDQGADGVVEDVPDQVSAISRIADTQTPVMSLYYKQDDNQVSHDDKWWERFSSKTLLITLIVPTKTFTHKRWKLSRFLMSQKLILLVFLSLKVRWTFCREKLWFLVNSTFRLIELEILSGDDGRADFILIQKGKIFYSIVRHKWNIISKGNIRFIQTKLDIT